MHALKVAAAAAHPGAAKHAICMQPETAASVLQLSCSNVAQLNRVLVNQRAKQATHCCLTQQAKLVARKATNHVE
jgi:siroheme synthase